MNIRYSETVRLSASTIEALSQDSINARELLRKDIEYGSGKIVSLLRRYERLKDNGGKIFSFTITGDITIDHTGAGFFEAKFPVQLSYGCRELNEWIDEKMVLSIQVDFTKTSAIITGEEVFVSDGA
jgi:hypothetical protein